MSGQLQLRVGAFEFTDPMRIEAKGKEGGVRVPEAGASAVSHAAARRTRAASERSWGAMNELRELRAGYDRVVAERGPADSCAGWGCRRRKDAADARVVASVDRGVAAAAAADRPLPVLRAGHHVLAAGGSAERALWHPRQRLTGDGRGPPRRPRGTGLRPRPAAALWPAPTHCARSTPRGLGESAPRTRGRAPRRPARGGCALGRAGSVRPARHARGAGRRPAARRVHGPPRAVRQPADLAQPRRSARSVRRG